MCTVQIYDAERRFVNEIPVRTTLEGVQYADDLAKESPAGSPTKNRCRPPEGQKRYQPYVAYQEADRAVRRCRGGMEVRSAGF